ncbi:MAG: porin family protein [Bacteroidota bacterium]
MNKYLLTALAMAMGLSVHAQISFQKVIKIGLKAGVNVSTFTKDVERFDPHIPGDYGNFDNYVNVSGLGGITLDYNISERLSLGAELQYSGKGSAYWEENNDVVVYDDEGNETQAHNFFYFDIDYVELPLMINYNVLPSNSKVWLKIYGGVSRGVAVRKKTKMTYPKVKGYRVAGDAGKAELRDVRNFNTSVIGGLKVGGKKLHGFGTLVPFADLRGSYTLSPVFNRSTTPYGENLNTRMFTLSVAIGVQF